MSRRITITLDDDRARVLDALIEMNDYLGGRSGLVREALEQVLDRKARDPDVIEHLELDGRPALRVVR